MCRLLWSAYQFISFRGNYEAGLAALVAQLGKGRGIAAGNGNGARGRAAEDKERGTPAKQPRSRLKRGHGPKPHSLRLSRYRRDPVTRQLGAACRHLSGSVVAVDLLAGVGLGSSTNACGGACNTNSDPSCGSRSSLADSEAGVAYAHAALLSQRLLQRGRHRRLQRPQRRLTWESVRPRCPTKTVR